MEEEEEEEWEEEEVLVTWTTYRLSPTGVLNAE
jgi:hypothetical protein